MTIEYLNNKTFETLIVKFQTAKKEQVKFKMFMDDIKSTEKRTLKRGKYKKPPGWLTIEKTFEVVNSHFKIIQDELAITFYTLVENIVRYAKFNLVDQDDAIQEGVMSCFEKVDRFDSSKGKAFNYLTTVVINCLRQSYRTARNYNELKRKYLDFVTIQIDNKQIGLKKSLYKRQNLTSE